MRRTLFLSLLCAATLLSACTAPAASSLERDTWLEGARLEARETPGELYAAALQEDPLVIYSVTSRLFEVKDSFERAYPGLTVEMRDIRSSDLLDLLRVEEAAGGLNCDLVVCSDGDGALTAEMISKGLLHKYVPWDIADKLSLQNSPDQLIFLHEIHQVFYNSAPESSSALTNWWELTEPRYYGRVYIATPLRSATTAGTFITIVQQGELLAQAYEERYGRPLAVPEGSSPGLVFFEKLFANGLVICNSSDEVIQAVGRPGQTQPAAGIAISSKVRLRTLGYEIIPAFGLSPYDGVHMPCSIMVAHGSESVSSAKLFIRWLLGEADGSGEGLVPYLTEGAWSCRGDVSSADPRALEELSLLPFDMDYLQANRESFLARWVAWQAEAGNAAK